ncbi:DUF2789 domain-containing protein [Pseudomonas wadenswilerensis]|jgi:hypothetical protein|uniref:DUF2789 domain-containing protein n=2 Tax=Pseudomonas TaxID=286 RepID=A0AAP0SF31_9PSED|nr:MULTISPECIES: DUF2789 domain-containing protein [Pseudomonas]MDF9891082.1 hypothetical protein [Pseudomonas vranovensis]KDN99230.1 DUF2789 domain-containing protein [Pseudomonas donghuensis]MBF4206119.1 DUF2789 domain-containing protein [Pseudomonas donghuensis]MCP6693366.1 DUF2789 domain-containing protein [Pseudomonas donghuensis]MCP6696895.1 DUF2789 domain-containing protein [Pseudomonas donghuensis]
MEAPNHKFSELFKQLGLPDDPKGIDQFITSHSPLKSDIKLVDAPFWTSSQRAFLKDSIDEDADWAVMFDQLNEALRRPRK